MQNIFETLLLLRLIVPGLPSTRNWAKPMTPFKGVRSSCDMLGKNRSLASEAFRSSIFLFSTPAPCGRNRAGSGHKLVPPQPVGGPVADPGKTLALDKSLRQARRELVFTLPVGAR